MGADRSRVLWQGLITGLVGYAVVAIYFAVGNLIEGRSPFYTAALMGGALFYGVRDLAGISIAPGPIFAYNGFHMIVFLMLGYVAAWLAQLAERGPHLWYVGVTFYIFIAFHVFGATFVLPAPLREAMLNWGTLGAGVVASVAMALFLIGVHPKLRAEMRDFAAQDSDLIDLRR